MEDLRNGRGMGTALWQTWCARWLAGDGAGELSRNARASVRLTGSDGGDAQDSGLHGDGRLHLLEPIWPAIPKSLL
ncbi:hypothetical protein J8J14_20580 [Roseomonas sp. SSH11]|uniref:Uncharacterized protein n=1 Tax=Pararoseomonas baculiformis TaxID=2820812 RepID=A0ABS4AJI2_9PROT|nr:hypothetical protein [Pararoseomonas baculiformis]MBP0447177.1 hypothetical protein [Pararoseomonas baculiformis]